ncbi:MAG: NADH:ubiquinone reductase (Na(+)-transporting) subunit F [Paracoccaceae bacterium]
MTEILLGTALLTGLVILLALVVRGARAVLTPSGPVTVTLNGETRLTTRAGEPLLSVLSAHDILIPSACAGAGTCGLCRVRVTEGGGDALPTEAARLSRADLRDGYRLACQLRLRGDLSLEVPGDLIGAETYEAEVASARFLTPLIREVVFQLPQDRRPEIVAGSFLQVTAPPYGVSFDRLDVPQAFETAWSQIRPLKVASDAEVTRAYSISNRPEDTAAGRIVLNIRLALPPPTVPEAQPGIVSSYLCSVNPGDPVTVSGPFGSFRAQDTEAEMVLIGGGVGMAPLRAIILDQLGRVGSGRKISFWYGARSLRELYYAEEFDALAAQHPNFSWTVALSEPSPEDNWQGPQGFIHSVVWQTYLRDHPAPEACEYYLCGPPMMIRAVMGMLEDAGVDRSSIFNDDFGV